MHRQKFSRISSFTVYINCVTFVVIQLCFLEIWKINQKGKTIKIAKKIKIKNNNKTNPRKLSSKIIVN